jgi:hypothetical protein
MKKYVFLILAMLVIAVSCSSNDDEMGNDSRSEIEGKSIADSLVEVSSMQEWLITQINYFVNEHDMGLDIYKGTVNDAQYYVLMTVYFNTPYVYTEDGKIIEYPNLKELLKRQNDWKRIYSYRPTKSWSDEYEKTMMFWSKYN